MNDNLVPPNAPSESTPFPAVDAGGTSGTAAAAADPFAPENFQPRSNTTTAIDDLTIELRPPSAEEFVRVSQDPQHTLTATLLVVTAEEGYGKTYYLLTPKMREWALSQPSLRKFVKTMQLFLYVNQDGEYALWPIRDSLDHWSMSDLQVLETAKKMWTRRYTLGKVRKAHTSQSVEAEVVFPQKGMFGPDGLLAQVFGEALTITSADHNAIKKLMG